MATHVRSWDPGTIANSAIFATLASGVFYFLGFSYLAGNLDALNVPGQAAPLSWTSHVRNGFVLVFWASQSYFLVTFLLLGLTMAFGWVFRLRLRRRVTSGKPMTTAEQERDRFWTHLFDPAKIMARAPRWIVPLLSAGMLGSYLQAVLDAAPPGAFSPAETALYETLTPLGVFMAVVFLLVAALDPPPSRRSFYEMVRRGGPLLQILVVVLSLFTVANYAYAMGSLEAEASIRTGLTEFPHATLHMKDPLSTLHGREVVILFHADSAYFIKDMGDARGAAGPVILVPTADVAFMVYA